ncbi:hypothetical protein [Spiroplasma endosymbiont of Atherix ibis]|uniref:hypothetical protein n=1 Tax=Spiroplasma endosymbiont of Atherix ibis TaxID=3066291 RepID=UPI0030CC9890
MYYVDNNKSKNFSKYSDQLKENMASNPNAAKEIMFQNSLQILRKGYEIYNINGKMFFFNKKWKWSYCWVKKTNRAKL